MVMRSDPAERRDAKGEPECGPGVGQPVECKNHAHAVDRGSVLNGALAGAVAASVAPFGTTPAAAAEHAYADPAEPGLPKPDVELDLSRAALVLTDPQVDFLSPNGVTWQVVGESVQEHNTVVNIGRLLEAAKRAGITVAVSPHYY